MAVCGMVTGYLLGCALALLMAGNWLEQNAKVMALENDAASAEARDLLSSLAKSPYLACSEAEIAYFRELVFRSYYLKDAGRIHGGKIDCSATAGHPMRSLGQVHPEARQEDGTIAYGNLIPIRDPNLKRVGLQLGTGYVVFNSHVPARVGPVSMHFEVSLKSGAVKNSEAPSSGHSLGSELKAAVTGKFRFADIFDATQCSTLHPSCVTASASVSDALQGETTIVVGSTIVGGLFGAVLGMALSFYFNRSRDLCQQLRRAISRDQLEVVYQPIVNLKTERIIGAEALARWNDEDGNAVPPDVFIKIAEDHGFVGDVTKSVLRRSLSTFADTLRSSKEFRLSVNLSAADLVDTAFLAMLDDSLNRTNVRAQSLALEITERSTAENDAAMETIRELRRREHSIHIDDFGTGYSNLDRLLYLWADTIKIDKAFTKVIGTQSVTVALLPQILAMAKSLDLEVVVEGVENQLQANYFWFEQQEIHAQGWFFGRPVPGEEFQRILADNWSRTAVTPVDPAGARSLQLTRPVFGVAPESANLRQTVAQQ